MRHRVVLVFCSRLFFELNTTFICVKGGGIAPLDWVAIEVFLLEEFYKVADRVW